MPEKSWKYEPVIPHISTCGLLQDDLLKLIEETLRFKVRTTKAFITQFVLALMLEDGV